MRAQFWARASVLALAAGAAAAPQLAAAQNTRLADEIVVTVTRSEQNVQDVPIAITAYSGDLLDKIGVGDIRELSVISPSLVVVATQSEAVGVNARIRGVGTVGDNPGLQSSVGVFIDEVYRSRNSVALGDLGEIAAIEVARGPQGTLFGRNSSAGAIVVRTKAPDYEFGGYGEYTRTNYNGDRFEGALNIPLARDVMAVRVNGFYDERDGFLTDYITGVDYNDRDQYGLRGQILFEPGDNLSFRLIGDYASRDEVCCAAVTTINGPTAPIVDALTGGSQSNRPLGFNRATAVTDGSGYTQDVEEWGVSLKGELDAGFATLASITAYREFDFARSHDIDYTRADVAGRPENGWVNGYETFTQEVRANGSAGALDWLLGVYYSDEKVALEDRLEYGSQYEFFTQGLVNGALAGTPLAGAFSWSGLTGLPAGTVFAGAGEDDAYLSDSRSIAVYTNNTIHLSDSFSVMLGGRYTNEKNDFSAALNSSNNGCLAVVNTFAQTAGGAPPNALAAAIVPSAAAPTVAALSCLLNIAPFADTNMAGSRKEEEFTWDAKFTWRLSDNVSFFGGAARGYKAGGYNMDRAGLEPLAVAVLLGGGAPSYTAPDLEFEEETVLSYEAGFKTTLFDGNATLNITGFHSNFEDYQLNTFNGISFVVRNVEEVKSTGFEVDFLARPTDQLFLQGGMTYANTRYDDDITTDIFSSDGRPLNGRQITLAPKWAMTGAMTYQEQLWDWNYDVFFSWNFRYTSSYNTGSDLDPEKLQEAYVVANASIGLLAHDSGLELEAFVRNITNTDYMQVAFDSPLQSGGFSAFLGDPRTYGATVRFRF